MKNLKIERMGLENINNQGFKMKIINYQDANNVEILFENGYKTIKKFCRFKNGTINNPYFKSIYGKGYMGEGKHLSKKGGKNTSVYDVWVGMFRRCYDKKCHIKYPTYINCTVCEKWHNFQNFAKWYDNNYYEIEGERIHIDKDLLVKGNKIYSPTTCVLIPHIINSSLINNYRHRGEYCIGITIDKRTGKYIGFVLKGGVREYLGLFDSEHNAFLEYKKEKENYLKYLANKFKNHIPNNVYNALINYKIEAGD